MNQGGVERLMYITRSPAGTYSEKVVKFATQVTFQKTIWRLLLRVALKKDGLVLRLQKNFLIRNGTTEKNISIKSTDTLFT